MGPSLRRAKIALFEPWGLGDLAISLHIARAAHAQGAEVTVLCAPAYVDWVRSLPYVAKALGVSVPWTKKSGKYRFSEYPWREWRDLRRTFASDEYSEVIETRRDPRAAFFLRYLLGCTIRRPKSRAAGQGYGRLNLLPLVVEKLPRDGQVSVACFFGAEWPNRRVPHWRLSKLLEILAPVTPRVAVIIPPDEKDSELYRGLSVTGFERIEGSVAEVAKRLANYTHFVSTDSGWLHVAHLAGLSSLGLFGFENDRDWLPPGAMGLRSEHCLPENSRYRPEFAELSPLGTLRDESFAAKIESLIGKPAK